MNEHFQNSGEKQPQGVKMKQGWDGCSEVGMVLGAASPGATQMLVSSPACGEPNVCCTLITKFFQRASPSPHFILISNQNHWERMQGNVDPFVLLFTLNSYQYNTWLGSDLT